MNKGREREGLQKPDLQGAPPGEKVRERPVVGKGKGEREESSVDKDDCGLACPLGPSVWRLPVRGERGKERGGESGSGSRIG